MRVTRRVRLKTDASAADSPQVPISTPLAEPTGQKRLWQESVWMQLPEDTIIGIIARLPFRDRARVAAVCRTWRRLSQVGQLWRDLDLRAFNFDTRMATCLSPRCASALESLALRGGNSLTSVVNLKATALRALTADFCIDLTDAGLGMVAARHENLQSLQLADTPRVTGDAIRIVAMCCPRLMRLRLSGLRDVDGGALQALAHHCPQLQELALNNCHSLSEGGLARLNQLRLLSVAGSRILSWNTAAKIWPKLPNLTCLDVSHTEIATANTAALLAAPSLQVFVALSCSNLEGSADAVAFLARHKVLFTNSSDLSKSLVASKSLTSPVSSPLRVEGIQAWVQWVISHALLRMAERNEDGLDTFWLQHGASALQVLAQSQQEDVQERAATALATFVVRDDENATVDNGRAEAVLQNGGATVLLRLARSPCEGVQAEAAKALANLSVHMPFAQVVAGEGGIQVLARLAGSPNRWVAEEAAGALWNLSVGDDHKGSITSSGAVEALVLLVVRWQAGAEGAQERAAGALANLAADEKSSVAVAKAGGVKALVSLARFSRHEGVQEQAARALANMAAHGDSNNNNREVGQEPGALDALVQLTRVAHDGVRQEAAGALWNLSFDDRNREAIAAVGGVHALVALARASSSTLSAGLQERAAGALWGLSVSEANSTAIGREGGVGPLIQLARSSHEEVHETAAGALWNLAFNPLNAMLIVAGGGVPVLVTLCATSKSRMARFMAALALAYVFDGGVEDATGVFSEGMLAQIEISKGGALAQIECFLKSCAEESGPSTGPKKDDLAAIVEAGHLRCSALEIGRFVQMLKNTSPVLRTCAAFALLQFTMSGGRHIAHHATLLVEVGARKALRAAAANTKPPMGARVFAKGVLRNLELAEKAGFLDPMEEGVQ